LRQGEKRRRCLSIGVPHFLRDSTQLQAARASHKVPNHFDLGIKVVAADYKGLTALYSEDARLFPPGKDIIAGEEAILNYWTLPEGVSIIHHKISPVEIVVKGKKAYDYGRYEGKTKLKDGSVTDWKGKYVIVWKREGKEWRIYLDSWSRID
jgi:ketosteroid isomerase-like protein